MSNLEQWIENINNTNLCKHRKAKAIAGITRELTYNTKVNMKLGFNLNDYSFSNLFSWKNTPEGHAFWVIVRNKLMESGGNQIIPF